MTPADPDSDADIDDALRMYGDDMCLAHQQAVNPVAFLHTILRSRFKLQEFRDGQLWAIQRVLAGKSTLLVAPTGSGKSLCYQVPAAVLPGLTIVVSPLVALMQDQLDRLPSCLKAMCLSGIEATETHASFLRLRDGNFNVLFLSPERLMSSRFQAFARTPGALPPISLVSPHPHTHTHTHWAARTLCNVTRLIDTGMLGVSLCPHGIRVGGILLDGRCALTKRTVCLSGPTTSGPRTCTFERLSRRCCVLLRSWP